VDSTGDAAHRRKVRFCAAHPFGQPSGLERRIAADSREASDCYDRSHVITVRELTRAVRRTLESGFSEVAVRGEVGGVSRPQSGHVYFTLRDTAQTRDAQLAVVLWREEALRLRCRLAEGEQVVVWGRLAVYAQRGIYQLVARRVDLDGPGALAAALRRLKQALAAEGLFAAERKRPLPLLPRCVGVITSPSGAAVHDILKAILRRHPRAWIRILPVRVQGDGAAEDMTRALRTAASGQTPIEVVVLARGGGSMEDLAAFNEECVVRAVAACRVPTISAIGHEVDESLCDLAADVRAQTPTHAGELVVPDIGRLVEALDSDCGRLRWASRRRLDSALERLERARRARALAAPADWIGRRARRVEDSCRSLEKALYSVRRRWHDSLRYLSGKLEVLSPVQVLKRGYAVVFNSRGIAVRRGSDLVPDEVLRLVLGEGSARVRVDGVEVPRGE